MSDPEKPTTDDLAPGGVHLARWEDAKTTEEALRRNLFHARADLIREGMARNAAESKLAKVMEVLARYDERGYDEDLDPMLVIDRFREAVA